METKKFSEIEDLFDTSVWVDGKENIDTARLGNV